MGTTEAFLDLHRDTPVAMLDHEITDRRAWTRDTVQARDWTVSLPDAAVAELLALAETVGRQPLPVLMLSPDQFPLKACRETMARVKTILPQENEGSYPSGHATRGILYALVLADGRGVEILVVSLKLPNLLPY